MLIYSMSVSVDGFIAGREGAFGWTAPNEEQFRFHIAQTRELGGYLCGRRLYETMLPWETDQSMRDNELGAAFADVWCAIPKVVSAARSTAFRATPGSPRRRWPRRPLRRSTRPTRTSRSAAPAWPRQRSSSASSTSCACSAISRDGQSIHVFPSMMARMFCGVHFERVASSFRLSPSQ